MAYLVVLAVLVGGSAALPHPQLRYAFNVPTELGGETKEWIQFVDRARPGYLYGYEFPGRMHYETKDEKNTVKGVFQYHDPNGDPVVWEYMSDPIAGYTANIHTFSDLLQEKAAVEESVEPGDIQAVVVGSSDQQAERSRAEQVEDVISPLLKQAAEDGEVIPVGSSLSGTPTYAVSPEVAAEAGGVSALAYRLGAIPVAAVHDAQVRPTFTDTETANSPVLVHHEHPKVTLYTLEVPIQ